MRLLIPLLLLAPQCFASKCKTCRGGECENNSVDLLKTCTIFSSTVPFVTIAHSDKELLDYGCLQLEYLEGGSSEIIRKCVMAENPEKICDKIAEKISYVICNVQSTIVDQELPSINDFAKDYYSETDAGSDAPKFVAASQDSLFQQEITREELSDKYSSNNAASSLNSDHKDTMESNGTKSASMDKTMGSSESGPNENTINIRQSTTDQSNTYDIWGDSSTSDLVSQETIPYDSETNDSSDSNSNSGLKPGRAPSRHTRDLNYIQFDDSLVKSSISEPHKITTGKSGSSDSTKSVLENSSLNNNHFNGLSVTNSRMEESSEAPAQKSTKTLVTDSLSPRQTSTVSTGGKMDYTELEPNEKTISDTVPSSTDQSNTYDIWKDGGSTNEPLVTQNSLVHQVSLETTTKVDDSLTSDIASQDSTISDQLIEPQETTTGKPETSDSTESTRDDSSLNTNRFNESVTTSKMEESNDNPSQKSSETVVTDSLDPRQTNTASSASNNNTSSELGPNEITTSDARQSTTDQSNTYDIWEEGGSSNEPSVTQNSSVSEESVETTTKLSHLASQEITTNDLEISNSQDPNENAPQSSTDSKFQGATSSQAPDLNFSQFDGSTVKSTKHSKPQESTSREPGIDDSTKSVWEDSSSNINQVNESPAPTSWMGESSDAPASKSTKTTPNNALDHRQNRTTSPAASNHTDTEVKMSSSANKITIGDTVQSTPDQSSTYDIWKDNASNNGPLVTQNSLVHQQSLETTTKVNDSLISDLASQEPTTAEANDSPDTNKNVLQSSTEETHSRHTLDLINTQSTQTTIGEPDDFTKSVSYDIWGDSSPNNDDSNGLLLTTQGSIINPNWASHHLESLKPTISDSWVGKSTEAIVKDYENHGTTDYGVSDQETSTTDISRNRNISSPNQEKSTETTDLGPLETKTYSDTTYQRQSSSTTDPTLDSSSQHSFNGSENIPVVSLDNFDPLKEATTNPNTTFTEKPSSDVPDSHTKEFVSTTFPEKDSSTESTLAKETSFADNDLSAIFKDWSSTIGSFEDSSTNNPNIKIPGTESHSGDIPLDSTTNGGEARNPDSISTTEESHHWQDSFIVVEATTSEDWNDASTTATFDDSSINSPQLDISTDGHSVDDLDTSNGEETRNPNSTSPNEETSNWQDFSVEVETSTSENWNDASTTGSSDDSTISNSKFNIQGTEGHPVDDLGPIPSGNAPNGEEGRHPKSTSPIEGTNHWQDSSVVFETSTSENGNDASTTGSFDDSTINNTKLDSQGTGDNSVNDLGDISSENAPNGEEATSPDSASPTKGANHWQDSSIVVETSTSGDWSDDFTTGSSDYSTINNPKFTIQGTEGNPGLGNIPLENASTGQAASTPHASSIDEETNHWQDSSTVVGTSTSENWNDASTTGTFDDSTVRGSKFNTPKTEGNSVDDLGDIPSGNSPNGEEARNSDSTSPTKETNRWQDSSTVIESSTNKNWKDDFTTGLSDKSTLKSLKPNTTGTENNPVNDLGDISSPKGEGRNPKSTSPLFAEPNDWPDSSKVVETSTSKVNDASTTGSFDNSTINDSFNTQDTEGNSVNNLGNIPLENTPNGEKVRNSNPTSPTEETNHWQDSSTVIETTTSENWSDDFRTDLFDDSTVKNPKLNNTGTGDNSVNDFSGIPMKNASNEGVRHPKSTSPITEPNYWQDSSEVVETSTSKVNDASTTGSFDDSTINNSKFNTQDNSVNDLGDIPPENTPNGEEMRKSDPTSRTEETNHWQDSSIVIETSTSEIWSDDFTTGLSDDSTVKNPKPNTTGTGNNPVNDLGDISLKNTPNGEVRNSNPTSPIEKTNHWEDSSTIIETSTSGNWSDDFTTDLSDDSTVKNPELNTTGSGDNPVKDLGDISSGNGLKGEEGRNPKSTSPIPDDSTINNSKSNTKDTEANSEIEETNHWQDSSTAIETSTSEIWSDDSTTGSSDDSIVKSPELNTTGTGNNSVNDAGDIPPESGSNAEEASHWQHSSVVVETSTNDVWNYASTTGSFDDSTIDKPKFTIQGTEGSSVNDLGDIPMENTSNGDEARNQDSPSPIPETNHWQDSSEIIGTTTSKNWKGSSPTDTLDDSTLNNPNLLGTEGTTVDNNVPLDNATNFDPTEEEEATNPDPSSTMQATTSTEETPLDDLGDIDTNFDSNEEATTSTIEASSKDDSENIPFDNDSTFDSEVEATTVNINSSTIIPAVVFDASTPADEESGNESSTVDYEDKSSRGASKNHLSTSFCFIAFVVLFIMK